MNNKIIISRLQVQSYETLQFVDTRQPLFLLKPAISLTYVNCQPAPTHNPPLNTREHYNI